MLETQVILHYCLTYIVFTYLCVYVDTHESVCVYVHDLVCPYMRPTPYVIKIKILNTT
jgi:hypothetical protein